MIESLILWAGPQLHMWVTFGFIGLAVILYASDRLPIEVTSLILLSSMMMFFQIVPYTKADGTVFTAKDLIAGFGNDSLLAVLALLVMGQAVTRTDSLHMIPKIIIRVFRGNRFFSLAAVVFCVIATSAFVNDTPTCIIYMPVFLALATQLKLSPSRVMIPLSYSCILGGTLTLIGSSTNLLVSGSLQSLSGKPLGMFDFTLPGLFIAAVGFFYIAFILPRLLPDRQSPDTHLMGDKKRQFVIQLEIDAGSNLIGKSIAAENLLGDDISLRMLQRNEHAYLAPFDEPIRIRPFDVLVLTATKEALIRLIAEEGKQHYGRISTLDSPGIQLQDKAEKLMLTEVLITPASKLIGQNIEQIGFYHEFHCTVVGIQRKSRMISSRMTEIRLAAGDILMVMGTREQLDVLRQSKDFILMEWSVYELPSQRNALKVNLIFGGMVAVAAFGILPVYIASFVAVLLVLMTGCLTTRQAIRAVDAQIIMLVAAGFGLALALELTGGAIYLAALIVDVVQGANPVWVMSAMFGVMAFCTNVLSNNATALLFTPIAYRTAQELGVEPAMFVHAVIFASNCCSFATPIGFQTNLLVMGPGHYKFTDYFRAGIPLMVMVWATYTAFCFMYY